MARGRPIGSDIRQRIIEILYFMKEGYGYDIYKIYSKIFPQVTMRSIYYHLNKGVNLEEIGVGTHVLEDEGDTSLPGPMGQLGAAGEGQTHDLVRAEIRTGIPND